jgi:hypothetical protein
VEDVSSLRKLCAGLEVDIYSADGVTKRNAAKLLVYYVDPLNNSVRIDFADGTTTFTTAVVDTDVVVLADSKGNGPTALDRWFISSGTGPYGLNSALLPQILSIVVAVGGNLTDTVLRKYFAGRLVGWGESAMPDTILTTPGVLSNYVAQFDTTNYRRYEVQGEAYKVRGGYDGATSVTIDGREVTFTTCAMVPQGFLYAFKMKNGNIKRYVPPRLPGVNSGGGAFNKDIEFFAPLGGSKDIWKHAHYNSNTTKYLEAPFVSIEEYIPEEMGGIKLTGLTEERAVS